MMKGKGYKELQTELLAQVLSAPLEDSMPNAAKPRPVSLYFVEVRLLDVLAMPLSAIVGMNTEAGSK